MTAAPTDRRTDDPAIRRVETEILSLRERLDLIWAQHEREHSQHELAHGREHEFSQKAIDTAAVLARETKNDSNEWRSAMRDREAKFATKDDVKAILDRLDSIEDAGLVSVERERLRAIADVEDKRQMERRQSRGQWQIGLVVGLLATAGAVLVNLVLRLAGA